jgi:uracil-DNA glycosylase
LSRLTQPLAALLDAPFGDWQPIVDGWRSSPAGRALIDKVDSRVAAGAAVFPEQVFRALQLTPLAETRVVILGQDPYHGPGQAEGLAFSVPAGQKLPPSLRNIFKELSRDLGVAAPASGSLVGWARRGVLLLNATLTVEEGRPAAHSRLGWWVLTDAVFESLVADSAPKAFLLWGAHAQSRAALSAAAGGRHLVLQCNHPSPLAAHRPPRPFLGCGHFGLASRFVAESGRGHLDWALS